MPVYNDRHTYRDRFGAGYLRRAYVFGVANGSVCIPLTKICRPVRVNPVVGESYDWWVSGMFDGRAVLWTVEPYQPYAPVAYDFWWSFARSAFSDPFHRFDRWLEEAGRPWWTAGSSVEGGVYVVGPYSRIVGTTHAPAVVVTPQGRLVGRVLEVEVVRVTRPFTGLFARIVPPAVRRSESVTVWRTL